MCRDMPNTCVRACNTLPESARLPTHRWLRCATHRFRASKCNVGWMGCARLQCEPMWTLCWRRKRLNSLLVTRAPHYRSCDICCCVCIDPAPPVMREKNYRCVQNTCLGCGLRVCADCSQGCTHCEATCAHVRCEGCGHLFCDTCSTVDFDHGSFERRFCLDCYTRNSAEPAK